MTTKTIANEDLEELVSICRGAANALMEKGFRLKAAAIHELADLAVDQHRAQGEAEAPAPAATASIVAPLSEIAPAPHRHKWADSGRCEWPDCTAKPRKSKKSEAPAAEGGGSPL